MKKEKLVTKMSQKEKEKLINKIITLIEAAPIPKGLTDIKRAHAKRVLRTIVTYADRMSYYDYDGYEMPAPRKKPLESIGLKKETTKPSKPETQVDYFSDEPSDLDLERLDNEEDEFEDDIDGINGLDNLDDTDE